MHLYGLSKPYDGYEEKQTCSRSQNDVCQINPARNFVYNIQFGLFDLYQLPTGREALNINHFTNDKACSGGHMRRREFITLLGATEATWPLIARAQQPAILMIGLLRNTSANACQIDSLIE